jgi:hypothetical protein
MSQNKQILEYLKNGNSITPLTALEKFNCLRLSARILDLKDKGYNIKTEMVKSKLSGKTYAKYTLLTNKN